MMLKAAHIDQCLWDPASVSVGGVRKRFLLRRGRGGGDCAFCGSCRRPLLCGSDVDGRPLLSGSDVDGRPHGVCESLSISDDSCRPRSRGGHDVSWSNRYENVIGA